MEYVDEAIGVHLLAAYNRDDSDTGASTLNLGGGTLFTSMEDQTLDAIGAAGSAWMTAIGYHFGKVSIEGLDGGIAYARFRAEAASMYDANELDIALDYQATQNLNLSAVYADTRYRDALHNDTRLFRIIVNRNF